MRTAILLSGRGGTRIRSKLQGLVRTARAHPVMSPRLLLEVWRERKGFPVEEAHDVHLSAAVAWLARAQDATVDDGFARGYSLNWNPYFSLQGWQPSYPETTGYIIPTFFMLNHHHRLLALDRRAERAARWELEIQLSDGAVQGGVIGQPVSPSVFNTGQVILGWLVTLENTGDESFAKAVRRAGNFLVDVLEVDGQWRTGNSKFARADSTLYNARTAWALAEAGVRLQEPSFIAAATRNLLLVSKWQKANGWLPHCCLSDPQRPLLHTLAYAIRGLLEGGRILEEEDFIRSGALAAERLAEEVRDNGWMSGRYDSAWSPVSQWSCLTGNAQMVNIWLRLFSITGKKKWLEPVGPVVRFLKATQNRGSMDPGVRGGIRGSFPISGDYGRYQVLNWATKFFVDALFRHRLALAGVAALRTNDQPLA